MRLSGPFFVLILLLMAAGGTYVALAGLRTARAYREFLEGKDLLLRAEATLARDGLSADPEELSRARAQVLEAEGRFRSARDTLAGEPLLRAAGWLPWLGGQVTAAKGLAEIGVQASQMGLAGLQVLDRFNDIRQRSDVGLGQASLEFLEAIEPQMEEIEARAAAMERIREDIAAPVMPPLAGAVDRVGKGIAEARDLTERYRHIRRAVPALLGFEGQRRYLVLGQDNTELFPTGGIIAIYGVVTLDQGELSRWSFRTASLLVDDWLAQGGQYVEPPRPLKSYLLRNWSWNFVLANWSPAFPRAAQQALWFYRQAGGEPVDGVIGLDFTALEGLLAVTGPITLEEYGLTLDSSNVTEQMLIHTRQAPQPGESRHAVALAAVSRILEAIFALDGDRWDELVEAVDRLVREKHLFLYSLEEPVQASVRALGWDGGLAPLASDYLMVVEASVHSTKLNLVIQREMRLEVSLDGEGTAHHRLTLRYHNDLQGWARGREPELVRSLMMDGLYGGYLRVLAPPGARLVEVTIDGQSAGVEEIGQEEGCTSFGRYFSLAAGEGREVSFSYAVPSGVSRLDGRREYRLYIQKQGGTPATPLSIDIRLPGGSRPQAVILDGERLPGAPLHIETALSEDRELRVRY